MPSELNLKSAHELAGLVKSKLLQSSFRTLVSPSCWQRSAR